MSNEKGKFTPGPWKLNAGREIETSSGKFFLSYGYDENKKPDFKNFVELDANSRLIAAAPEMLSALQELYKHCAMIHKSWGDGDNQKEANAAIEAGRKAILKTLGE